VVLWSEVGISYMCARSHARGESSDEMTEAEHVLGSFRIDYFRDSVSWQRLRGLLANGGSYAICGPARAGKTWLMQRAITEAQDLKGIGLYFSCPGDYNANSFLSALSGALADEVTKRARSRSAGQKLLALISTPHATPRKWRYLGREAVKMREHIRFSANLTFASERGISGSRIITAVLSQSRQRVLSERPATTAALVFDFRNFASDVARIVTGPLVIGVDGLDKLGDIRTLLALLRDVAGILDLADATFLVAVSKEAAIVTQPNIASRTQSEFTHPFSQMIEISPLTPIDARELFNSRQFRYEGKLPEMLCLLSGGNEGDLTRMAESCQFYHARAECALDQHLARHLLADESEALLRDIQRMASSDGQQALSDGPGRRSGLRSNSAEADNLSATIKYRAMCEMARANFADIKKFVRLGRRAMRSDVWDPPWGGPGWHAVQERWRIFLVRMFLTVSVLDPEDGDERSLLDDDDIVSDLRDVVITSRIDADVAKLMLAARFGDDFSTPYHAAED
jgi:hypothetical protein